MSPPTWPAGDCEDVLRRALHSAADPVQPADDGLERIQARLTTPDPLPVAWVVAAGADLAGRARGGLQSALAWLQSVPERMMAGPPSPAGQAHEGYGVTQPAAPHRPWLGRARLAAVVAAVTLIMAMSVSAVTPFGRQMLSQAGALVNSINGSINGSVPAGTGEPGVSGQGNGQPGGAGAAPGAQNHGQPAATCASSTPAAASPSARPATSPSPASPSTSSPSPGSPSPASPSPSSPSPSVTPTPSSTVTASTSPTPASPSSPSLASASRAGPRQVSPAAASPGSGPCASPAPSPSSSSSSRPPAASPAPTSPGPSSPPPASPAPSSPAPSSPPATSPSPATPSPSSTAQDSTAPATTSPASSGPVTGSSPPRAIPAADPADPEGS